MASIFSYESTGDQVPFEFKHDGGAGSCPSVKVGGHEIANHVRHLDISAGVGQSPEVRVSMLARHGMDVSLSAHVAVQIQMYPGYELVCLTDQDGTRRFVSRREAELGVVEKASRAIEGL